MKHDTKRSIKKFVAVATLFCMATQTTFAAFLDLATKPLFIGAAVPPMVMLNIPKDHQMFGKLYSDFADVDGNGTIDTSYDNNIDYYGYFDPFKCYTYTSNRYEPAANAPTKYCTSGLGQWSGNFLNWVSMSRIDAVRKLLYGGFRTADSAGLTVLERATIPTDGHGWAKHYRGADLAQLTPFTAATVPTTENFADSVSNVTIGAQPTISVTSIARGCGGNNCTAPATVTTGASHNLLPGMTVTIAGATGTNNAAYNKTAVVISTPTSTTFTYSVTLDGSGNPNNTPAGTKTMRGQPTWTVTQPTGRRFHTGDMVRAQFDAGNYIDGAISFISGTAGSVVLELALPHQLVGAGARTTWRLFNRSSPGITICNTVQATAATAIHANINTNAAPPTTVYPPLMRIAHGDFSLWAVSDGKMCQWSGPGNGNNATESELTASRNSPVQANVGLLSGGAGPDFNVRVKVCDPALLGTEKCLLYEGGNWKPIGLLQQYSSGDTKLIQFGLMTPTYSKNKSGGVLRKQVSFLDARPALGAAGYIGYVPVAADELDPITGIFRNTDGIIKTLNSIQMYGYALTSSNSDAPKYSAGGDGCTTPGTVNPANNNCTSWGNPTSEMYIESLRYLAGRHVSTGLAMVPTSNYALAAGSKDSTLNLAVQSWNQPVTNANWCAPLNVIVMNASVSSYDSNEEAVANTLFTTTPQGSDAKTYTDTVGALEGFTAGTMVMTGSASGPVTGAPAGTDVSGFGLCTPKGMASGLGAITGICPEAPMLSGTYQIAGAAFWARHNRIVKDLKKGDGSDIPATDVQAGRVNTYGITLSGSAPRIRLTVPNTLKQVTILPAGRTIDQGGSYAGTGSIVDFKIVRQNTTSTDDPVKGPAHSGKFFVSWEDSLQGNDYDLDIWGVLSYQFLPVGGPYTQIQVTSDVVYGATGFTMGFGFVMSGVTNGTIDASGIATYGDGAHYVSGFRANEHQTVGGEFFPFHWPPATGALGTARVECNNCLFTQGPRSITFNIPATASSNVLLEDPLYYAGKYGGFKDFNKNGVRDPGEWDSKVIGQPDNFFLVTNPAKLEEALEESFISILSQASASSVATNSQTLVTGTTTYQARFNANDWSGQLLAFPVQLNGTIDALPAWDAGDLLKKGAFDPNTRNVITFSTDPAVRDGVPFRLTGISSDLTAQLYSNAIGTADPAGSECTGVLTNGFTPAGCTRLGEMRLNYLRGDALNEGATSTKFRSRPVTKLGDIANSNPIFVGPPNAGFGDSDYVAFRTQYAGRKDMIYVGANDGMLHAFSVPENGKEYFAYVPSTTFPHLTKLTSKAYQHRYYVDGSPEVADAFINVGGTNRWRSVLVSTVGGGGQGLFALDVTDPEVFKDEANAASTVLWEFTERDDPNFGYSLGQPVIRKMANNRWAAIVAGGYNNSLGTTSAVAGEAACTDSAATPRVPADCTTSTTGEAYIYVIFLDGPSGPGRTWVKDTDYVRIGTGVGAVASPNGLASPFPTDANADGMIDFIYAGDLVGNLFKFDVRNASPSQWDSASNRVILFTATTGGGAPQPQPITSKAVGTLHPTGQGFIIGFGTGKYLEPADPSAPYQKQTFYGIWDKNDAPVPVLPALPVISGQTRVTSRDQLLEQTIDLVVFNGRNFRVNSANTPDWSQDPSPPTADDSPTKDMGWFMDFPTSATTGERSVFRPILTSGRLVFTTLIPDPSLCEAGGSSFLMVVDPTTGGRIDAPVLDVDANGILNTSDVLPFGSGFVFASGVQSTIGITPTPNIVKTETPIQGGVPAGGEVTIGTKNPYGGLGSLLGVALQSGSKGENASTMIGLAAQGGRVSWRELLAD